MENQHRKITGYRELDQRDIDLMNEIKARGEELEVLIAKLRGDQIGIASGNCSGEVMAACGAAHRWISIGETHLQQGLMALTRAVAKPSSF